MTTPPPSAPAPKRGRALVNTPRTDLAVAMARAGRPWAEIGAAMGISKQGAWQMVRRYAPDLPPRERGYTPTAEHCAKLRANLVLAWAARGIVLHEKAFIEIVRGRRLLGQTETEIASDLGVTKAVISGVRWRHLRGVMPHV